MVVMAIVPVTAMPYAAARFEEVLNPSTRAIVATPRSAFTSGT